MEWTTTKKVLVGAVVALPFIVVLALMFALLNHSTPGGPTASDSPSTPSKASNSVPLASFCSMAAGNFGTNPSTFWGNVPRGLHVASGVAMNIDGAICLYGRKMAEKSNSRDGKQVLGIPVNQAFGSLYVCHSTFFASPPKTPVYDLVLRYEDGSSATNEIEYSTHVFDWSTPPKGGQPPTGANSIEAWHSRFTGAGGIEKGLSFYLTEFKNPHPSVRVLSLDLYSCENDSSGVIAAVTTGPSGLVHNKKAK